MPRWEGYRRAGSRGALAYPSGTGGDTGTSKRPALPASLGDILIFEDFTRFSLQGSTASEIGRLGRSSFFFLLLLQPDAIPMFRPFLATYIARRRLIRRSRCWRYLRYSGRNDWPPPNLSSPNALRARGDLDAHLFLRTVRTAPPPAYLPDPCLWGRNPGAAKLGRPRCHSPLRSRASRILKDTFARAAILYGAECSPPYPRPPLHPKGRS